MCVVEIKQTRTYLTLPHVYTYFNEYSSISIFVHAVYSWVIAQVLYMSALLMSYVVEVLPL